MPDARPWFTTDDEAALASVTATLGESVDLVSRTSLVARAAGSPRLLERLSAGAASNIRAHRDPLDALHGGAAGSTVQEAARELIEDYSDDERRALALLGRLDGAAHATALRACDPRTVDELIRRAAVHDGVPPTRVLHANRLLSIEAENTDGAERVDSALDDLIRRELSAFGDRSNPAILRTLATEWYADRPTGPTSDEVDDRTRRRALALAAARANAVGDAELALAFVRSDPSHASSLDLAVEESRAHARAGRFGDAYAVIEGRDPREGTTHSRLRLVQWWGALVVWHPQGRRLDALERWIARVGSGQPTLRAELDAHRADAACLDLDWASATSAARRAFDEPEASPSSRVRAGLAAAAAAAARGRAAEADRLLSYAEQATRDPVSGRPLSVSMELSIIGHRAFIGLLSGRPPSARLEQRLHVAVRRTAERDDPNVRALAGVVCGIVLGVARGDDAVSERELSAALDRVSRIELAVMRPLVANLRAGSLARLGSANAARIVLDEAHIEPLEQHRLYRFGRHLADYDVAVAEDDVTAAGTSLTAAAHEHVSRTRPRHDGGSARARAIERWAGRVAADAVGRHAAAPSNSPKDDVGDLTDREREIAVLVGRRLTNKEIAARLYISVRTVESHVYTARGKLGADSRRELGSIVGL